MRLGVFKIHAKVLNTMKCGRARGLSCFDNKAQTVPRLSEKKFNLESTHALKEIEAN